MSSPVSASFDISRPTGRCQSTGVSIEAGSPYIATLSDDPVSGKTQRLDFSSDAWAAGARPAAPLVRFATWRATMPDSDRPETFLPTGELVDVFEQLVLGDDEGEASGPSQSEVLSVVQPAGEHTPSAGENAEPGDQDHGATASESRAGLRYLLALALLRKRALVLDEQIPATREHPGVLRVRRWTRAGEPTADILEVIEPRISDDRLAELAMVFAEIIEPGSGA